MLILCKCLFNLLTDIYFYYTILIENRGNYMNDNNDVLDSELEAIFANQKYKT